VENLERQKTLKKKVKITSLPWPKDNILHTYNGQAYLCNCVHVSEPHVPLLVTWKEP
jgi:hypothetical protein